MMLQPLSLTPTQKSLRSGMTRKTVTGLHLRLATPRVLRLPDVVNGHGRLIFLSIFAARIDYCR